MTRGLPDSLRSLLTPRAYSHPVESVTLVETHISWVLLTGTYAYKIKRPVKYPFVDLTSMERRAFFCHEELRLNRRFAPELYLDVCPITLDSGLARVSGEGEVIEHAVRMRQFDREEELDRLLASGRIAPEELERFGRDLAQVHAQLPAAAPEDRWGQPQVVRELIARNIEECRQARVPLEGDAQGAGPAQALMVQVEALEERLAGRRAAGRIRECHGDLHSRNIVRSGSRLVAFDCIEFEPAFRWIDVAEEVAFLLADLEAQEHGLHANAFLRGYLSGSGDYELCRLLPVYQAHRALIRAKVSALRAAEDPREAEAGRRACEAYLEVARCALAPKRPALVLMSGLSGSGKTWLAARLAPALDAVHLRSDVERKRLAGLDEHARTDSRLGQGLYSQRVSESVYRHLAESAEHVLAGGMTVIVDATFGRREDRALFKQLATKLSVPLTLLECHAPRDVLRKRVAERHERGSDASEADLKVLEWQETHTERWQPEEGIRRIEVNTGASEPDPSVPQLVEALRPQAPASR